MERGAGSRTGGIKSFLTKRLFSLGMLLSIAFLLLVSLVISAAPGGVGDRLSGFLPSGLSAPVLEALNFAISLLVIGFLFAARRSARSGRTGRTGRTGKLERAAFGFAGGFR